MCVCQADKAAHPAASVSARQHALPVPKHSAVLGSILTSD